MEIAKSSLDDLLAELYPYVLDHGTPNKSGKGNTLDTIGVLLRLSEPRARLSRSRARGKPFSALGELLWYLAGSDKAEFINAYHSYYAEPGKPEIVPDAYGPRLRGLLPEKGFTEDQLETTVVARLRSNPGSRNALVQIYDSTDAELKGDKPCTTTLQFHVRGDRLHMTTTMRSNDAYIGLPHDLFCFTMLQEMAAVTLDLHLGEYVHFVGSMHIYEQNLEGVQAYLNEGFHRIAPMPPMPRGDAFRHFDRLLEVEKAIRGGSAVNLGSLGLPSYYEDLARLLVVNFRSDQNVEVEKALEGLHHTEYHTYMDDRSGSKPVGGDKSA